MTVAELIERLKQQPQGHSVVIPCENQEMAVPVCEVRQVQYVPAPMGLVYFPPGEEPTLHQEDAVPAVWLG